MHTIKIAIVSYKYSIEVSPTLKGMAQYLIEKGMSVDFIVDDLFREKSFSLAAARIIAMPFINQDTLDDVRRDNLKLYDLLAEYDFIFAVEMHALEAVYKLGFELKRVVYMSFELDQVIHAHYNRDFARTLILSCAFCLIQDKSRASDLQKYLGCKIPCKYLPVSLRKQKLARPKVKAGCPVSIVYSGYLADWSYLAEFVQAFIQAKAYKECNLTLHGHAMGTGEYVKALAAAIEPYVQIKLSTAFYDDQQYQGFLSRFNIGLALYVMPDDQPNWNNLLFSSGKIASYLWAGLAVVTNIRSSYTLKPPFLFVSDLSASSIRSALAKYQRSKSIYARSALEFAGKYYDLDKHMQPIAEWINKQPLPKRQPLVSIFMPVYNAQKYLAQTIDSILGQSFSAFELIIADDGSTDKSLPIARQYSRKDSRIKVLALAHKGEVNARNQALKYCDPHAKYLMNHDSDDISLPDKLAKLVAYLENNHYVDIVGCFAEYFDDAGNIKGQPPIESQPQRIRASFGQVNSMINSAALVRREVFKRIGGYRQQYQSADDYDFFTRALEAGFVLANIDQVMHRIRLHASSIGSTRAKQQEELAAKIRSGYNRPKDVLNILHTVEFYYPHIGGAEAVIQQVSEQLAKRGHHVSVATTKLSQRKVKEHNGVRIVEFDLSGSLGAGIKGPDIQRYQDFIRNYPADIMLNYAAQQWATDLAFTCLPEVRKTRVNIIAPCGYSALKDSKTLLWPGFSTYFQQIIPKVVPLYDAAIYHSAVYKDYFFAQEHQFTNSVVIPNAVSQEEFVPAAKIDFRRKYKITTKYMGLCVANFYAGKGHDQLIQAYHTAKRKDLTLVFIGKEGTQLEQLKQQAGSGNIRFLVGIPRADTVSAYKSADVFLFASQAEAAPLVIIEAKAAKLAFISTDCGNVKEYKGGIVCAAGRIAFYMNRLLDDRSLRKQLAQEGFGEWEQKLTWTAVIQRYEQLYRSLYAKKSGSNYGRLEDIQKAIDQDHGNINLYQQAASLLLQQGRFPDARRYIEDGLEINWQDQTLLNYQRQINEK